MSNSFCAKGMLYKALQNVWRITQAFCPQFGNNMSPDELTRAHISMRYENTQIFCP